MGVPAIDLSQAPDQLRELVEEAARAGEVVLTRGGQIVARIVPVKREPQGRQPGSARGLKPGGEPLRGAGSHGAGRARSGFLAAPPPGPFRSAPRRAGDHAATSSRR
jgi:antitoxin (DNA-binding transcriptional repressor) of toxin-antitoxin stability system